MKYSGVVILYNPEMDIINNIQTYINDIDILYAVDNSDYINEAVVKKLKCIKKVEYINNNGNQGIAHAMNVAIKKAMKMGYDWILTMDQDSQASEGMVSILKNYIEEINTDDVGILSAYQKLEENNNSYFLRTIEQVLVAMTSGNLLNINAYRKVGKFREKLFIDFVDYEYCLRLSANGYRVLMNYNAILNHKFGNVKIIDGVVINSHNSERLYYYVRNWGYISSIYRSKFPSFFANRDEYIKKKYIETIFYDKHKVKNLLYMFKGFIDYRCGIFGKFGGLL